MTIISAPCFLFVYDPFSKFQQSEIMEVAVGTTIVSNYNDVGLTLFVGATMAECEAKIIELQLTPVTQ